MIDRKLRMGMVGGGIGSFIGAIHRMGAMLDGKIDLVCGAFSSDPKLSSKSGKELFLRENRVYGSFLDMMESEARLPADIRMDFVSIVTPNHMHFEPAMRAIQHGFPVITDKPLVFSLEEAQKLKSAVKKSGLPFAVTYTYTGYPMVKQARAMVKRGEIGKIRKVMVEYPQGWMTDKVEDSDSKQVSWRVDPKRAGRSNCFGDIGTHAANMAEYVSGLKIVEVLAEMKSFVPGRILEDDVNVLLHLEDGATGVLSASQVSPGEENNLKIRISGDKGGLEWANRDLNTLIVKMHGKPVQFFRTGVDNGYLHEEAGVHTRTPSGHPEGYIEAFANIYRNFGYAVAAKMNNSTPDKLYDYPGIDEGFTGMALIDAVLMSSENGNKWTGVKDN